MNSSDFRPGSKPPSAWKNGSQGDAAATASAQSSRVTKGEDAFRSACLQQKEGLSSGIFKAVPEEEASVATTALTVPAMEKEFIGTGNITTSVNESLSLPLLADGEIGVAGNCCSSPLVRRGAFGVAKGAAPIREVIGMLNTVEINNNSSDVNLSSNSLLYTD